MRRRFSKILMMGALALLGLPALAAAADASTGKRPWRILHVMSYESHFDWSDDQFAGFKTGFGRNLNVEYQVLALDAKRNDSIESLTARAREARQLISDWQPDLLYVSDDAAVEHVLKHYANTALPCVFSGMNRSPAFYGLEGARNVTGALEQEMFIETIRLLQQIKPGARRIHLISDRASYWVESIERIEKLAKTAGGMMLVGVDRLERYDDFQRTVLGNPHEADAYLLLGVFNYKDAQGRDVPFKELQQWVAESSRIPDVSFWLDRIKHGTLAGVAVSSLDQGRKAGQAARQILIEGRSPASIPIEVTRKGIAAVSIARARSLGLTPRASVLLTSQVSPDYAWAPR